MNPKFSAGGNQDLPGTWTSPDVGGTSSVRVQQVSEEETVSFFVEVGVHL